MSNGRLPDPAKEQFWRGHVHGWQRSGVSVRHYCQRYDLAEPSFYGWRRTLAERDAAHRKTVSKPEVAFVPIHVVPEPATASGVLELVFPDGRLLRIPADWPAERLRVLLGCEEDRAC